MRKLVLIVVLVVFAVALVLHHWRTKNISPVQRGWVVAEKQGCFSCHGPGGIRGMANPGYELGNVPDWDGGTIMMYAKSREEIYEWILDGMPARIRNNPAAFKERSNALIQMPAWRGKISQRDLDDLVAFVEAVSRFKTPPPNSKPAKGLAVADQFGCFNCHGPMGRGSFPNARSFKGYIPSWDGADFPELVANDQELRNWILDGSTKRIADNPAGRWFLTHQVIHMPAYRGKITDEEVDVLIEYMHWLRQ